MVEFYFLARISDERFRQGRGRERNAGRSVKCVVGSSKHHFAVAGWLSSRS